MKFLKSITIALISTFALLILCIEFGGKYFLDAEDRRIITVTVGSAPKLPENFITFYNTVYPKSLSTNSWDLMINNTFSSSVSKKECPCSQTAYTFYPHLTFKTQSVVKYFIISRYIEHHYNPKNCLSFNFDMFDFLENRKGVTILSKSLFNKKIKDLSPVEMAEILSLYENPAKNNRNTNPQHSKVRTAYFYDLYIKNLNK
ncbi:transglycosylase domain-containing protein [Chryseobacterium herbae]|uniref:Transglycosylase domain-containing protein n=1 Tax=Chryseobacterium herbae TaxID=2976476 RepID=A0ABT2IPZ3_9FLAO|nr:transglycosylase domain-containing protein [Chryseobacterium sp. pc1-10]MCT2560889.1 transglycosylase domain-containing protein [Chryseobacterium sp. pc1-10]